MIIDAHMHMDTALTPKILRQQGITCIANAATPKEYEELKKLQSDNPAIWISAGIHPWKVEQVSWEEMLPFLKETRILGEIGLDSVWCKTDKALQYAVFEQQLSFAQEHKLPVILHLKGMEKDALEHLRRYENRYLVHWYSCGSWLQEYIDMGCWFTIGPSLPFDETVQQVAAAVPLKRLLVETDGISACTWCEQREVLPDEHGAILKRSMVQISEMRNIPYHQLEQQMQKNCEAFLQNTLLYM